jgi:hypothetical protein
MTKRLPAAPLMRTPPPESRSRMRRLRAYGVLLTAIIGASALIAPSARAANGPPVTGCDTSSSCGVQLASMVKYGGNRTLGATRTVVGLAEPPCLWIPEGDAHAGSQWVIDQSNGTDPGPGALFNTHETFLQAQQLLQANPTPPGEWYYLPVNPAADAAAKAQCYKLPLYFFDTPGTPLPAVYIPPQTLGQLAYAHLDIPGLGTPVLNPVGLSDANLPTTVRVPVNNPGAGALGFTGDGRPYVAVTASIQAGAVSATVWAVAEHLNINPGTAAARTFDADVCSQAANGGRTLGSRLTASQLAAIGVNGSVDCGVTYARPGAFALTGSIGWTACWAPTPGATEPPGPPPANCDGNIQGAQGLADSTFGPVAVNVREIQTQG